MSANALPKVPKRRRGVGLPPPDSRAGLALLGSIVMGLVYVLVFVSTYSALSAEGLWVVVLTLLLGVVVSFFLVSMISSERARASDFELEFARTVQAHLAAGETIIETSPLGGILTEYARVARDQRSSAREHAYAAGPAIYGTGFALVSTLLLGLAYAVGSPANLIGVAMLFELPAFLLLFFSTALLALSVGRAKEVAEFSPLVLRRWLRISEPSFPFTHSVSDVPWTVPTPSPAAASPPQGAGAATPDRS